MDSNRTRKGHKKNDNQILLSSKKFLEHTLFLSRWIFSDSIEKEAILILFTKY